VSDSVGGRRRVLGGILLAVAGAYILFQPFGATPGTCVGSLARIVDAIGQAITMCVAASAVPFVVSSLVGLLSIIAALWVLLPGAAGSRTAGLLGVMALAIIAAGIVAIITSPTGPFRTFPATQTANPVQIPAPTRGP
jgi:hypothetical protein